jgi:hypothetical protein
MQLLSYTGRLVRSSADPRFWGPRLFSKLMDCELAPQWPLALQIIFGVWRTLWHYGRAKNRDEKGRPKPCTGEVNYMKLHTSG